MKQTCVQDTHIPQHSQCCQSASPVVLTSEIYKVAKAHLSSDHANTPVSNWCNCGSQSKLLAGLLSDALNQCLKFVFHSARPTSLKRLNWLWFMLPTHGCICTSYHSLASVHTHDHVACSGSLQSSSCFSQPAIRRAGVT